MKTMARASVVLVCGALTSACGPSDEGPTRITSWQGVAPHLVVQGVLDGENIDATLEGEALGSLHCDREYEAPPDAEGNPDVMLAKPIELVIIGIVSAGGQDRIMELELKAHDFQKDPVPSLIQIIPRVETDPVPSSAMWMEWEWHTLDDGDLLETAAQTGTFQLDLFDGVPTQGEVIPPDTGSVGGFARGQWSEDEELVISFTAPCAASDVELVE